MQSAPNHFIGFQTKEILKELVAFNTTSTPIEDNMIFFTEDDDFETYPDLMLEARVGLDTIERKRWGYDQQKHSKMTRFRGTGTKYPIPAKRYNGFEDMDEYRNLLHESLPELLGLEGFEIDSEPVTESEDYEGNPIYGIFTSRFSIIGDYSDSCKRDLETLQYAMRGMTPDKKLAFIEENKDIIDQKIKFK